LSQLAFLCVLKLLRPFPFLTHLWDLLTALPYCVSRLGRGLTVAKGIDQCNRPKQTLILYDFEGCPFCRQVREELCILDLDVIVYPVPRQTLKNHIAVKDKRDFGDASTSGHKHLPVLIDKNTDTTTAKADAIVKYLWTTYGDKAEPRIWDVYGAKLGFWSLDAPNLFRPLPSQGLLKTPAEKPERMIELYGFEVSPWCRLVREALTTLQLPYVMHNMALGSGKRSQFAKTFDKQADKRGLNLLSWTKVPLLVDPNRNTNLFGAAEAVKYLFDTYQSGPVVEDRFWGQARAEKKVE